MSSDKQKNIKREALLWEAAEQTSENPASQSNSRLRKGIVSIILLLTLLFSTAWVVEQSVDSLYKQRQYAFQAETEVVQNRIKDRLDQHLNLTRSILGFFKSSEFVSKDEWKEYLQAHQLHEQFPYLSAVYFGLNERSPQADAYLANLEEGNHQLNSFYTWKYHGGERQKVSNKGWPILYVTPNDDYLKGLDLSTLNDKILTTITSNGDLILLHQLKLFPKGPTTLTFTVLVPGAKNDGHQRYKGIIGVSFLHENMFKELMRGADREVKWELYRGRQANADNLIFGLDVYHSFEYEKQPEFFKEVVYSYGGQEFLLLMHADKDWRISHREERIPYYIGGVGLAISLLIFAVSWVLENTRSRAFSIAENMTEELRLANFKLSEMATTDVLTGISNRRSFMERFEVEVTRAKRYNQYFSFIMFDIDYFKEVNDKYGHPMGDVVLSNIGDLLNSATRTSDISGRIGGEEFAVLLPHTDCKKAEQVAETLRNRLSKTEHFYDSVSINCSASFGVICSSQVSVINTDVIFKLADQALYHAKEQGRNCVVVFDEDKTD
ncbi:sensor domain-containing diguanylate cyclase [Pleionea sp. CnH1-48]|uniref:sensor domain-containing diguanylate cyclase n=1 Tax=Pleionea sp. CnH1-48 TaxID=2954494 RepID=UPI002096EE31|nr:sensor domain-containing diguanylate cyclase [Pleionea sp. CnH1-48]MCO7223304.1 sensor domain-containing diguanylate cyclase [Pleionea sp. CnH1-48]